MIVTRHKLTYRISEVKPYINWDYFYFAWQVKDRAEQARLRHEADDALATLDGHYSVHALFALGDANADGDDILFEGTRLPMLRQQTAANGSGVCLSLADFIRPLSAGKSDRLGLFATSVDHAMVADHTRDAYKKMMAQLLADRLAEAAAELMHEQVRKRYWGYAPDECLTMDEMHAEKFRGIRPAVGYPSLPDTSINFVLDGILCFGDIGIRLTGNGAMLPHASVSGLMMAHPAARYFAVGPIGDDQLRDYARRRGVPLEIMRRFLTSNLN